MASYVTTIPLLDEDISTGNEGYIAGWGCTKPIQNIFDVSVSQCLKELRVRILPRQICLAYRPKTHISETCTRASSRLSEHAYFVRAHTMTIKRLFKFITIKIFK